MTWISCRAWPTARRSLFGDSVRHGLGRRERQTRKVTVESAKQVAVLNDPGTRQITAAVKRWETERTTEAVLYLPDRIVRYRANATGSTISGFKPIDEIANPLGVVPVVAIRNSDRILDEYGASEIDDLIPLVDASTSRWST